MVAVITQLNPGDISAFLLDMEQCRVSAIFSTCGKDRHGNHDNIVFKPFGCVHCHDLDEVLITFQPELSVFGRYGGGITLFVAEPFDQLVHPLDAA